MKAALRISIIYVLCSVLWILLSDGLISLITQQASYLHFLSNVKGIFFVVTTGVMLFFLINHEVRKKNSLIQALNKELSTRSELIQELHHRIRNNLQGIISLLYHYDKEQVQQRILAMDAVFSLVYDNKSMVGLSLSDILTRYKQKVLPQVELSIKVPWPPIQVEQAVSLMLAMDAILGIWIKQGSKDIQVILDSMGKTVTLQRVIQNLDPQAMTGLEAERSFVQAMVQPLGVTISCQTHETGLETCVFSF